MIEVLVKNVVKREPGWLYFISTDGDVCRAPLKRGGKKKSRKQEKADKDIVQKLDDDDFVRNEKAGEDALKELGDI